jgi:hypothetical protein
LIPGVMTRLCRHRDDLWTDDDLAPMSSSSPFDQADINSSSHFVVSPLDLSPTHSLNPSHLTSTTMSQHLATDNVGPTPGHAASASFHSSHPPPQSQTSSHTSSSSSTTPTGPGHAHSVAQAQGLKLNTAASQQHPGSEEGRTGGGPMEGSFKRPGGLAENPNARSKTITMAEGENTYGVSATEEGLWEVPLG